MSETNPAYGKSTPNCIDALKSRGCIYPMFDSRYIPPTRDEKKSLCVMLGLSKEKVSYLTGTEFISDDWYSDITEKEWRVLLYCSGLANPIDDLDLVKSNRFLSDNIAY